MIIKLEDVAQFISGKAFTSKDFTDTPQSEGALPIIRIQNVNSEEAEFKYWDKEYEEKYIVNSGDLLMSLSGDFKLKIWNGPKALLNQRVVKIKVKKNVNKYYLFKYLQSKIYILMNMGNSSIINNLSLKTLKNFNIELPNLTIQNNIEKVIQKLDKQLLKRKEQLKLLDELGENLFVDMFGDPFINNKKWKIGKIKDTVVNTQYGTSKKADLTNGQYPILRMNNITYKGGWDFTNLKYIDIEDKDVNKYLVKYGEVLFNRTNSKELVGKTAVYREQTPMAYAGYLIKLTPNENFNGVFIAMYLNSNYVKSVLYNMAKNIVGMANINAKELTNISIFLPPLSLQNEFAKKIEKIEELKKQCQKSLEYYEELYETLLHKAFNGELFNE
ncbi:restriction endonuclease subunit S [Staphylococcus epidermidis]|uniref:restriction endonuclease subunit S n=1 Tax=Staphylococcus epidermidis TaxID=1282 RepID=UPI002902D0FB|nr:restriction endonuclease subunit S [Staphylococcus epidermidis]MCG1086710.1 restriction endonuclease subunit S [Staphylococcus epidermidis]MCG2151460.1 restriction endonuclease subunit S [Staphylococcus epidermidis]MDU0427980.1 restriction endonuclease subunit S [Staphylococcus epidermidis]MDU0432548.1 restriction endonuclease subunit S [Staphylococcus epidermidis]MDU0446321.1 restriction endonuclease subunit S [Staphylococcus epidermidis]